ncbi:MAG: PAS domain-containing protein [Sphingomonas bacterium]|nr:PAS domain-containing protein [Sphingomonas bacterium]
MFVTHHSRETHVLLSIDAYRDLKNGRSDDPDVADARGLPTADDFIRWTHQGCIILDADGIIVRANQVAHAMTSAQDGALIGKSMCDALPALKGSLVETYVNRTMNSREPSFIDLPSTFRPSAWVRLEVYPSADHTTLMFHDITDDVNANRLANPDAATRAALVASGQIGMLKLNVRGQIERADDWCQTLLGLSEDRLKGIEIHDLVPRTLRVAFKEKLDSILGARETIAFETSFLTNTGDIVPVCGGAAELYGTYGSEGAIIVLTRA